MTGSPPPQTRRAPRRQSRRVYPARRFRIAGLTRRQSRPIPGSGTASTGTAASRRTFSAIEPKNSLRIPPRPCVPMTTERCRAIPRAREDLTGRRTDAHDRRDGRQSRHYALSFRFTECLELRPGIGLQPWRHRTGWRRPPPAADRSRARRRRGNPVGRPGAARAAARVGSAQRSRLRKRWSNRAPGEPPERGSLRPRLPYSREDTSASAKPS